MCCQSRGEILFVTKLFVLEVVVVAVIATAGEAMAIGMVTGRTMVTAEMTLEQEPDCEGQNGVHAVSPHSKRTSIKSRP